MSTLLEPDSALSLSTEQFHARFDELMQRIAQGEIRELVLTANGAVIAVVTPPDAPLSETQVAAWDRLHGAMRGQVQLPEGFDLASPALDEPLDAERGVLAR